MSDEQNSSACEIYDICDKAGESDEAQRMTLQGRDVLEE